MKSIHKLLWLLLILSASGQVAAQNTMGQSKILVKTMVKAETTMGLGQQASGNVGVGLRFNPKNYLGVATGLAKGDGNWNGAGYACDYWSAPMLLDYTHFFPLGPREKMSILCGTELGAQILVKHKDDFYGTNAFNHDMVRPYYCLKLGMEFPLTQRNRLSLDLRAHLVGVGIAAGLSF